MAYLTPYGSKCRCGSRATVRLIGQFNNELGTYCKTCGNAALKRQQDIENKNWDLILAAETPERKAELRKMLA